MFEVSSGGHRGKDIPQCNMHGIYLHIIYYRGTLFTGSVMCFLSAWVLHIILACMQIEDIVHMQIEELALKRKLAC